MLSVNAQSPLAWFLFFNGLEILLESRNTGTVITLAGHRVGTVHISVTTEINLEETGYTLPDGTTVKTWWPEYRPSYMTDRGEEGPLLGPDQVICDLCNADILVRPVFTVGNNALCLNCFRETKLPPPTRIIPQVPLPLVPRSPQLYGALLLYCDVKGPDEAMVLFIPQHPLVSQETREKAIAGGLVTPDLQLTDRGYKVRSMVEIVLSTDFEPSPPLVPSLPDEPDWDNRLRGLYLLGRHPGCAWGALELICEGRSRELKEAGLADGEPYPGASWHLTPAGLLVLQDAMKKWRSEN